MESITQMAYGDASSGEKTMTPEEALDYLQDDSKFKRLSDVLKETMAAAGVCVPEDPQQKFINELYGRLKKQSGDCGDKEIQKITVARWFSGKTKSIRNRYTAIEICFALQLDLAAAEKFLNKCGFNSFSVRDAEDAAYLYCTRSGRPLSAAKDILAKYRSCPAEHQEPAQPDRTDHSGSTTKLLNDQIGNFGFDSDDAFLNTFLVPNRSKFIGYATTALTQYYFLKNYLFATVFIRDAWDEWHLVTEYFESKGVDVKGTDIPVSLALRSALRKYGNDAPQPGGNEAVSLLRRADGLLDEKLDNAVEILLRIRDGVVAHEKDIKAQMELSRFLSDIMKPEGLLKHAIDSIMDDNGRIRRYTDSSLRDSVMREFPGDSAFADYERDPGAMNQSMTIRKAIILMYFIAYTYDYSVSLYEDYAYHPILFERFGFVDFMAGIDKILRDCYLPKMYAANQFDWLIMRSVREFEISDPVYKEVDPIAFFNDVLAYSFGDEPEDEED